MVILVVVERFYGADSQWKMSEVLPYQCEPVPMENTSTDNEKSDSESESSSDEEVDEAFELENAWRVQSFS